MAIIFGHFCILSIFVFCLFLVFSFLANQFRFILSIELKLAFVYNCFLFGAIPIVGSRVIAILILTILCFCFCAQNAYLMCIQCFPYVLLLLQAVANVLGLSIFSFPHILPAEKYFAAANCCDWLFWLRNCLTIALINLSILI